MFLVPEISVEVVCGALNKIYFNGPFREAKNNQSTYGVSERVVSSFAFS